MLLPSGPNLIGIELRGFSIGELAAGTLFLMEVDADIEVFPVVEMLLDLVLGEHRPAFMPETGKLRQSFRLHNVTMLGATAFPVPIPIFFDEIGFEYTGIEGLELETHWGFPLPAIDAASIVGTARKLVDFLGDPQKQLQPGDLNDGDLGRFWSGPNYLQLPSYVGGKLVGSRTDDWEIDFAEQIVPLLNGIKRWDPLDLIRAFPIEKRVRKEGTTLFGFLDLGASWIVTTFDEFQELCEKGAEVRNQVLDELKAMPKRQRDNLIRALPLEGEPHASGLIMLLWGGWGIEGWASMEVSLGMAASGSKGVGTGYGIQGDLGNAAELALSSSAFVSKGSLDLGGHAGLRVADLLILDGSFSLHNDHFAIGVRSRLQVIDGTLRGHLSPSELVLAGDVQVRAGAFFSMNAQARIDSHHGFLVEGKWTYAAGQTQGVTLAAVGADSGLELRAGLETLEFNFVRFEGPALSLMYDPGADALAFRSLRLSGDTTVGAGIARGAGAITMTDPGGDSRLTLSIADGTLFGKYGCSLEATLPTSKFHQGPFDFRVELDKGICDALADAAFELLQFAASNYVLLRQARDFVARKKKLSEIPDEYAKRLNQIPKAMAERIKQVRTSKDLSGIVKKPIRDILKSAEDTLEKCDIRKVERTIEDCVDQLTGSVVGRLGGKEAAREIRKGLSYVRNFVYDQINSFIAQLEKKIPNWVELAPAVAARIAQAKRRDVLAIDGIVWHSSVEAAASRSELDVKVRARVNLDGKKWTPVQEIDLSLDPGRVDAATASLLKAIL
ncbi:MAG: hypothetical protein GWN99_17810 [Gemmatimonadetes bacterium]|uniref:Uncharacterized protein n=1 Tax=Candidatus Kutchimonas denitrificans TaxID=3056748 RepID=A0AAE4Z9E1_9BACT|nr:hypothetical protein [Gemmatimonadota bacterium]NIR75072.1 hypothetical protein [Candidatus Kutchimonas denitrificans]NIS02892.1 hypothetical protein [Gemmatimonadota bacterium]NIT68601.1 hypothetical protein [Gemmatimonadota bacterium]NIU52861.1 hypothetical protein [Gemmatimonadota bacterium]